MSTPSTLAASRQGDLHCQQAEQTQPDDDHVLTHLGLGQAKAMQGNGCQGGEGGRFKIHFIRQGCQQVARHQGIFGMHGVIAAGAGHPLPDMKTVHIRTQRFDHPGRGITQRQGFIQAVEGGFDRAQQTFAAGFVQHLAHQVGAGAGLAQQGFFGKFDHRTFGAGRNQRGAGCGSGLCQRRGVGMGTSSTLVFPLRMFCKTCFMVSSSLNRGCV